MTARDLLRLAAQITGLVAIVILLTEKFGFMALFIALGISALMTMLVLLLVAGGSKWD